jgi:hypothetical protein
MYVCVCVCVFFFLDRVRPFQKFLQSIYVGSEVWNIRYILTYRGFLMRDCKGGDTQVSCQYWWRQTDREDSARDILQTSAKGSYQDIAQCPSAASGQRCITIRITARNIASSHAGEGNWWVAQTLYFSDFFQFLLYAVCLIRTLWAYCPFCLFNTSLDMFLMGVKIFLLWRKY